MSTTNTANADTISAFEDAMMGLAPKFIRVEENNQCFDSVRNTRPDFSFSSKSGNRYSRKVNAAADYAAYVAAMQ